MNQVLYFWDKSHEEYNTRPRKMHSVYAIEKEKLFPDNSVVLDVGGGRGEDAIYFARSGHEVILTDISPVALETAQKNSMTENLKLKTIQINLGSEFFPILDSSVDIVYSRLTLHLFTTKQTVSILREISRVLKEGGKAYITLKSPEDKTEVDFLRKSAKEIEPGVYDDEGITKTRFTRSQLNQMLLSAGIEDASVEPYVESLKNRKDTTASSNKNFALTEIIFEKK